MDWDDEYDNGYNDMDYASNTGQRIDSERGDHGAYVGD